MKNEEITGLLDALSSGGYTRSKTDGVCSWCGTKVAVKSFRDALSCREYSISGMCQGCQDKTFKEE